MKPFFKLLLITVPLVAVGIAFLAWVIANRQAPVRIEIAERALPVRIIHATETGLPVRVQAYGLVRPVRVFEAIAQVGGTADWVDPELKEGAILPAGRVFLKLSPKDHLLAVAQAQANIRASRAKLAELDVSEENQKAALDLERKLLDIRKSDLDRTARLVERGATSPATLDAARAAWLAQRQKVLSLENGLALLPTQRQVLVEQIAVYEANLRSAQLNLERTRLSLPFVARVAKVAVETGQFVQQGRVVAVFDGVEEAEVEARIPLPDMFALTQTGDADGAAPAAGEVRSPGLLDPLVLEQRLKDLKLRAEVRLNLGGHMVAWPGRVDRLSDAIDQRTGTVGLVVRVDNAYASASPGTRPPLTKGMFVEVRLVGPRKPGFVVPRSALRDGQLMIADDQNRLRLIDATALRFQDDVVLLTSDGLTPDTRIVVSDVSPRVPGLLLVPQRDTALEARIGAAASDPMETKP